MEGKVAKYVCELKGIDAKITLRGQMSSDGKMLSGTGFTYNLIDNILIMNGNEFAVTCCEPQLAKAKTPAVKKNTKAKVPIERIDDKGNKHTRLLPTSNSDVFASWLNRNYESGSDVKCISYTDMISAFEKDNCLHISNKNTIGAKSVVTKAVNRTFSVSASYKAGYPLKRKETN